MKARDEELVVYSKTVSFEDFMNRVKKRFPEGCLFPEGECPYRYKPDGETNTVFLRLNTDDPLDAINSMSNLFFVDTDTGLDVAELEPVQDEEGNYGYKVTYIPKGTISPLKIDIALSPIDDYILYKDQCSEFNVDDFEYTFTNANEETGEENCVYLTKYLGKEKNLYIPDKVRLHDTETTEYAVKIVYTTSLTSQFIKDKYYYRYNNTYQWNRNPFFKYSYEIENVIISEGVEITYNDIPNNADFLLSFLPRLVYAKIPTTVISANYLFMNDISLKCYGGILIPQRAEGMFFGCESIEDISYLIYPNNNENPDVYGYKADMFFGCMSIKNDGILNFRKVYNKSIFLNGFMRHTNITEYDLPECQNISSYYNMLADCEYLERVDGTLSKYATDISNFLRGSIHVSGKITIDSIWFGEDFFNTEGAFSVNEYGLKDDIYRTLVLIPREYNMEAIKNYVNNDLDFLSCRVFLQDFIENYTYSTIYEVDYTGKVVERYISLDKYNGDINRLYIPDSYTIGYINYKVRINNTCFSGNTTIKYLAMGDNVVFRNLESAFDGCTNLKIGLDLVGPSTTEKICANDVYKNCTNLSNIIHIDNTTVYIDRYTNAFANLGSNCRFRLSFEFEETKIQNEEDEDAPVTIVKNESNFIYELGNVGKLDYVDENNNDVQLMHFFRTLDNYGYEIDEDNKVITFISYDKGKIYNPSIEVISNYTIGGCNLVIPKYEYINGKKYYIQISKDIFKSNGDYLYAVYNDSSLMITNNYSYLWSDYIIRIKEDNLDYAFEGTYIQYFCILLPNTLKSMKGTFKNITNSNFFTRIAKFYDAASYTSINEIIPIIPYGVEDISYMFMVDQEDIIISYLSLTALPSSIKNMKYAFYGRSVKQQSGQTYVYNKVQCINIPHNIEYLDYAFYDERNMESDSEQNDSSWWNDNLYNENRDLLNHYLPPGFLPERTSASFISNMPLFFLKSGNNVFNIRFNRETYLEIASKDVEVPYVWTGDINRQDNRFVFVDEGTINKLDFSIIEIEDEYKVIFGIRHYDLSSIGPEVSTRIVFIYESTSHEYHAVYSGTFTLKTLNSGVLLTYANMEIGGKNNGADVGVVLVNIEDIYPGSKFFIIAITDCTDLDPSDFIINATLPNPFNLFKFNNCNTGLNQLKVHTANSNYPENYNLSIIFENELFNDILYEVYDPCFIDDGGSFKYAVSNIHTPSKILYPNRGISGIGTLIPKSSLILRDYTKYEYNTDYLNELYPNWSYGFNSMGESLSSKDSYGRSSSFKSTWRTATNSIANDYEYCYIIKDIDREYEVLYRLYLKYSKNPQSNNKIQMGIMVNYSNRPSMLVQAIDENSQNLYDSITDYSRYKYIYSSIKFGTFVISSVVQSIYGNTPNVNPTDNIESKDLIIFIDKELVDDGTIESIYIQQGKYTPEGSNHENDEDNKEDDYYMKVSFLVYPDEWIADTNNDEHITSRYYVSKHVPNSNRVSQISYILKTSSIEDYKTIDIVSNNDDGIIIYTKDINKPSDIISLIVTYESGDEYGIITPYDPAEDSNKTEYCNRYLCPSHICQLYGAYWYACYYGNGDKMFDDIKRSLLNNITRRFKFIDINTGEDITPEKLFFKDEESGENILTLLKDKDGGFLLKLKGCHPNNELPFINDSLTANGIDFDIIVSDNSNILDDTEE